MAENGARDDLERIRSICLGLPDSTEKIAWGEPTFRVNNRMFTMVSTDQRGLTIWCKSVFELRDALIQSDPDHFFSPPYVGHKGWIGITIDSTTDWEATTNLIEESYEMIAAKGKGRRRQQAMGKRQ